MRTLYHSEYDAQGFPEPECEPGMQPQVKRRRLSPEETRSSPIDASECHERYSKVVPSLGSVLDTDDPCHEETGDISLSTTEKQAGDTVAPFLARHIPDQYGSSGDTTRFTEGKSRGKTNTKYCYRHRPDLKCRRQVNEPSMDQLQHELQDLSQADQQAIAHTWSIFSAAPAKQRNLILQGILTQCCFPQLSYLSTHVRELIRIDFLTMLPPEISFRVLCFLDTTSLCKAAQVSQRWRTLADDDVVWHRMCEQHIDRKCVKCGWGLPLLERKKLRASKRQIQLRAAGHNLNEWSPEQSTVPEETERKPTRGTKCQRPPTDTPQTSTSNQDQLVADYLTVQPKTRPWKDVYKDRFMVGTNWKYGRCHTRIFKGHQNGVMCLQFDDRMLASGSYDSTIKTWNIDTGQEMRTLRGHTAAVRCLQFDDTKLISGSLDGKIKVWNWRTGECLSTLSGHAAGVIGLHFDSCILASCSIDSTIRIWNFDDKSASVLRGHTDWVNAVRIDSASRTVFSASDDSTIKCWDLDTKTCIKTFEGHVGQVQQVVLLPCDFEFEDDIDPDLDLDGASSTASMQSHPPTRTGLEQPESEPYGPGFTDDGRPLPPRYILSSALDSTIRLWDTYTGKALRTYFGHVEGVWALAADSLRVVSGAQDRTVKVWDTRGRCERTFGGHTGPVTCIGLSDARMCSGSEDCEIRMYSF